MASVYAILTTPAFKGALSGLVSAAAVDIHALVKMNGWNDFKSYQWSTATFRWALGAATGALTALGYGALIS